MSALGSFELPRLPREAGIVQRYLDGKATPALTLHVEAVTHMDWRMGDDVLTLRLAGLVRNVNLGHLTFPG